MKHITMVAALWGVRKIDIDLPQMAERCGVPKAEVKPNEITCRKFKEIGFIHQ